MLSAKNLVDRIFSGTHFERIKCFNNPNQCSCFKLERVNPNHVGVIWGYRKKSSKGRSWIKVAEVYFMILPVSIALFTVGWFDALTGYIHHILASVGIFTLLVCIPIGFIVYFPLFKEVFKWLFGSGSSLQLSQSG